MVRRTAACLAFLALAGCRLQPGFEDRLTETYHCGPHWVVAYDRAETIRAQMAIDLGVQSLQEEREVEQAEGDFADGTATFAVYVGSCISLPECSDHHGVTCTQVLHHRYEAASGQGEVVVHDDGTIDATITGAVLEGNENEEPITIELWELPIALEGWGG